MANGTTIRTRKNALKMATWDPALLWYAKAVAQMKQRPLTDPTSWRYQTAVHGFNEQHPAWQQWLQGQQLPADRSKFWERCQHGTWYFLPWHRIYLGYFERTAAKVIAGLGGPADWALPYWNYNDGVGSGKLPEAFTHAKLPDGSTNELLETKRSRGNNGNVFLDQGDIDPTPALLDDAFTGGFMGTPPGFGGGVTGFNHSAHSIASSGTLEMTPHNQVHGDVGGLMNDPDTAAYDPIFWLHHANIDRLWEVWLKVTAARANPAVTKWQNFQFNFHDELGNIVSNAPKDIIDSKAAPFYYEYDDVSVPASAVVAGPPAIAAPHTLEAMAEEQIPEMVGSSSETTPLSDQPKTLNIHLFPVAGPAAVHALGAPDSTFRKAYLQVENVRGKGEPASYRIFLNVPQGANVLPENVRVGTIPTFGLEKASVGSARHPGNGLRFTFDVTKAVNALKAQNQWNPELLKVTFVPTRAPMPESSIEVGRVSLYFT